MRLNLRPIHRERHEDGRFVHPRLEKAEGWADMLGVGLGIALALLLLAGLIMATMR